MPRGMDSLPVDDSGRPRRTLPEIQERGHWRQMSSVRRYKKGGLVMKQWAKVSAELRARCAAAALTIGSRLLAAYGYNAC